MIGFEEFAAAYREKDALNNTVAKVNEWLKQNDVQVINVETVVTTIGGGMVSVDQGVTGLRVWYHRK